MRKTVFIICMSYVGNECFFSKEGLVLWTNKYPSIAYQLCVHCDCSSYNVNKLLH